MPSTLNEFLEKALDKVKLNEEDGSIKEIQREFSEISRIAKSAEKENDIPYAVVRVAAIMDKLNMIIDYHIDNKKLSKAVNLDSKKLRSITNNGSFLP